MLPCLYNIILEYFLASCKNKCIPSFYCNSPFCHKFSSLTMKLLSQGFLAGYIRLVFLVLIKNPDLSWVPIFWYTNENLAIKNQRFSPPLNLLLFSQQNMTTSSNRFPKDKHMFSVWNVLPKMKRTFNPISFI